MSATVATLRIGGAGVASVVGLYQQRSPAVIPAGFALVCENMRWDTSKTWATLTDQQRPWFEAANGAYVYWNAVRRHASHLVRRSA